MDAQVNSRIRGILGVPLWQLSLNQRGCSWSQSVPRSHCVFRQIAVLYRNLEIAVHNMTDQQLRRDLQNLSPGGILHKSICLSKNYYSDSLHVISGCCSRAPLSLLHSS